MSSTRELTVNPPTYHPTDPGEEIDIGDSPDDYRNGSQSPEQKRNETTRHLAVCGGTLWARLCVTGDEACPRELQSIIPGLGGSGAGVAMSANSIALQEKASATGRLPQVELSKVKVRITGVVGSDHLGNNIIRALCEKDIDVSGIRRRGEESGQLYTIYYPHDGRRLRYPYPAACELLEEREFETSAGFGIEKPDLLVATCELPKKTVSQIIRTSHADHIPVIFYVTRDESFCDAEKVIGGATYLIIKEEHAIEMAIRRTDRVRKQSFEHNKLTNWFLEHGTRNVVVLLREGGIFCSSEENAGFLISPAKLGYSSDVKIIE